SLTPAQRFTVVVKGDATADGGLRGDAYLDIKARLRENTAPTRSPVTDYSVVIDAVHTTGDADLKLWGSVKETNVTFQYSDTTAAGTTGAVWVQYENNSAPIHFVEVFRPDTPPGPGLDPGVFANDGASAQHIDSTYDI